MTANPQTAPARDNIIEADPDLYDASDSSLGDDVSKYTASMTSSIERYPVENGRRYHAFKDGNYVLPNDESELDRLDLTHQMLRITMGNKLHFAPIGEKPEKMLDIGTGTGIWAIEMGDDYPSAEIIGTDLSPTQPSWVPANVKFEIDDAEEPWTFQEKFDFVHVRYLVAAIADWPKLMRQALEHTKPGGWAEFQDFDVTYYSEDGSLKEEHDVSKWITTLINAANGFGRDACPGSKLEGWMKDAGFAGVQNEKFRLPIGPWAKDKHLKTVGAWNLAQIEAGIEGFTLRLFTQFLGWKPEEVQVLLANVRKDLRDPRIHAQLDFHVAYGQKPKAA
ncbi:hypothetical protein HO133_005600 [Letharia lupina]|uniref:Secondary metabolism regulator LAE1 n=1 Tax=Letharia lupina TaxID=560253 RepID=A0A8H6C9G7_9LECA|nr:uncharacterized protein HO133_005600 [Letharia lupina]KAF6219056.1 hypothetical protein HO133_005600 [Letharia lupina]